MQLLYPKNDSKKQLIFKNESILKTAKNCHEVNAIDFKKYSKIRNRKNMLKTFL